MLSKREYKFRQKLINENHYNKKNQKELDEVIKNYNITYHDLYNQYKVANILTLIGCPFKRVGKALKKMSISIKKAGDEMKTTTEILSELSEKWVGVDKID